METIEKELAALLAQDMPGSDTAFTLAVMTRIEQRRFHRDLLRNAAIALAAAAILLPLAPVLGARLQGLHGNVLMMLLVMGAAVWAMQWSIQAMDA
jgi:hypothetical protein